MIVSLRKMLYLPVTKDKQGIFTFPIISFGPFEYF